MLEFYHYFRVILLIRKKFTVKQCAVLCWHQSHCVPRWRWKRGTMGPIREAWAELFKARNMRLTWHLEQTTTKKTTPKRSYQMTGLYHLGVCKCTLRYFHKTHSMMLFSECVFTATHYIYIIIFKKSSHYEALPNVIYISYVVILS